MSREVAIGGRHDAHVHGPALARAQHLEGPVLQHAQQLHLRRRIEVADLVEEDRAAAGRLEAALAVVARVGERAAHVAEHLAFEQRRRDAAQVHFHERRQAAPAVAVDGVGDQFLAGAAFAGDEHRRIGARSRGRSSAGCAAAAGPRRPGGRSRSWRRAPRAMPSALVAGGRGRQPEHRAHGLQDLLVRPGLGDEVGGAGLHALHGQLNRPPRRDQHHRHAGRSALMRASRSSPSSPVVRRLKFMSCTTSSHGCVLEPGQRLGRRRRRVAGVARPASAATPATR